MSTRKLSHKGARQKGSKLERQVAAALVGIGVNAKRVPLSGALAWLKGDVTEFDVSRPHVHECKNCETLELPSWWRQAASQAIKGEMPVLHFTSNYQGVFTVLPGTAFDDLVAAYERHLSELTFTVTDFPQRKNFWRFAASKESSYHIYPYWVDGAELIIIPFSLYLELREQEVKPSLVGIAA